jgi:uncharacterized membrane protein
LSENDEPIFGPVQMLVLGFDQPGSSDAMRAEVDRLRDLDVIRLIDLLVIRKDAEGNVERVVRSDLTQDQAMEFGALAGALIGFGAEGNEESMTAGAVLGAAALEDGHVFSDEPVWYVDDAIPPDSAAVVALIEHRWAIPLREKIREAGGVALADAWIHPVDLIAVGAMAADEAAAV